MSDDTLKAHVREYIEAFEGRDLDKCLGFYCDDATLKFQNALYTGRENIKEWHKERFDADLRLVRLDQISSLDNTVTIEGVATSKRLRAWKINTVNGVITIRFAGDKIQELTLGARLDFW